MVDEDNLESEQTIKTIALFLTEPSSTKIDLQIYQYGSMDMDKYKLVTLPLQEPNSGRRIFI